MYCLRPAVLQIPLAAPVVSGPVLGVLVWTVPLPQDQDCPSGLAAFLLNRSPPHFFSYVKPMRWAGKRRKIGQGEGQRYRTQISFKKLWVAGPKISSVHFIGQSLAGKTIPTSKEN